MKLKPKARADRPNPTAYTLAIGSAEAREAGLIGNKGELYEVEKTVKAGVLVVTRKGRLLGINISAPGNTGLAGKPRKPLTPNI